MSLLEGKLYSEQSGLLGDPSIRRQHSVIQCHPVFFRETKELASSIICDLVLKHFFSFKLTELRTVNVENTET